jgi:hypothetical protein
VKHPGRKPTQGYRSVGGRYEGPLWVKGQETSFTFDANVQPLGPKELEEARVQTGGKAVKGFIKIYTTDLLEINNDIIIHLGERYVVMGRGSYHSTNSVASHNKYIAALEIEHAEDSGNV